MSVDCIENLKVGDVVCWSEYESHETLNKGMIDYVGDKIVVVRGIFSNTENIIPKKDLLNEDGQSLSKKISNPPHAQVLIDLEKEFPDVADDSMLGEIRQIKKLAQNIANNLNIMKNKC